MQRFAHVYQEHSTSEVVSPKKCPNCTVQDRVLASFKNNEQLDSSKGDPACKLVHLPRKSTLVFPAKKSKLYCSSGDQKYNNADRL